MQSFDRDAFNPQRRAVLVGGGALVLAAALRPLVESADLRRRMSAESLERISSWSYRECVAGLEAAVASLGHRRW